MMPSGGNEELRLDWRWSCSDMFKASVWSMHRRMRSFVEAAGIEESVMTRGTTASRGDSARKRKIERKVFARNLSM